MHLKNNSLYLYIGNACVEHQDNWFVVKSMEEVGNHVSRFKGKVVGVAKKSCRELGQIEKNLANPFYWGDGGFMCFIPLTKNAFEDLIVRRKIIKHHEFE